MKINKALIKHETRNMKWMLVYFLMVCVSGMLAFNADLSREYMDILKNGIHPDRAISLSAIKTVLDTMLAPMGIGVLLMIYLQFKDTKSVEVGNFLKALPINNKEYYITKFVGGLISITVPVLILVAGILAIRSSNMPWISSIQSAAIFPALITKADSVINITSILLMAYMVVVATYAFLFMMQYIVTNITAGLVIGCLVWLSPSFILIAVYNLYEGFISKGSQFNMARMSLEERVINYIEPWSYPIATRSLNGGSGEEMNYLIENVYLLYYDGLLLKIIIPLVIALVSAGVGYILSQKSRVEDSDTLISFKWARRVFIIGVTICSGLLLGLISQIFFGIFSYIGFLTLNIIVLIGAVIGFLISRKITMVKNK